MQINTQLALLYIHMYKGNKHVTEDKIHMLYEGQNSNNVNQSANLDVQLPKNKIKKNMFHALTAPAINRSHDTE